MYNYIFDSPNGIKYFSNSVWRNSGVTIAFSTRIGGHSVNEFSSLNMGLHVGDEKENVILNRKKLLSIFDIDLNSTISCEQIHGNDIILIDDKHKGAGALSLQTALTGYDGMITDKPKNYLLTYYADCIPVFFFDPVSRAVGIAHSGWKGTIGNIAANTIKAMKKCFNTEAENLEVIIGPGIAKCCFEIQDDLAEKVSNEYRDFSDIILFREKNGYKWDLHTTTNILLTNNGVKHENIINMNICTSCHSDLFFSYRRDQGKTGRMVALIGLEY